uniref:HEAT repeat domain-containing protein n=1 Tax=Candidatus Entotheonella palauensis TaxID=93172 RepID=UPI0034DEA49D
RRSAVSALSGLVSSDTSVRDQIVSKLSDEAGSVRSSAVNVLSGLVGSDASVRDQIVSKLSDDVWQVRKQAVEALAELISRYETLRDTLLPWLGTVAEHGENELAEATRRLLSHKFAPLLVKEPILYAKVIDMLKSPAWPMRHGAAMTLIAMPDGPPSESLPMLRGLIDDMRGEESWPERLQVAEILINDRDHELSQRAIAVALEALDYATQPWYYLPISGAAVRRQAAQILGQLEPLYRNDTIFARLVRMMREDEDANVRDAAYGALLRLAAAPEETPSIP